MRAAKGEREGSQRAAKLTPIFCGGGFCPRILADTRFSGREAVDKQQAAGYVRSNQPPSTTEAGKMASSDATTRDDRTPRDLMRQWERLNVVKNQLIKQGLLNGDAKATDVVRVLRQEIPAELFAA